MASSFSHLSKLVELAHERSSDKRRELLRDMSALFLGSDDLQTNSASVAITGDILFALAKDMETSVRAELSERFADHPAAPQNLVNNLARDVIEVARPLLQRSTAVSDEALAEIVRRRGAEHARAVAGRSELSEAVSEAVAATRDDEALTTLVQNEGAKLSRAALEHLVDHAEKCRELHEPLVERPELPPDLLNEMFFLVKAALKERIVARQETFDAPTLEAAFAAAERRLSRKAPGKPRDYDDAVRYISSKKLRKQLDTQLLIDLLMKNERTKFIVAFADLTGLQFAAALRAVSSPSIDPIAIACRASNVSREDFVRIAMFRPTKSARDEADATTLGDVYEALSVAAADRVMRFVKLREQSENAA